LLRRGRLCRHCALGALQRTPAAAAAALACRCFAFDRWLRLRLCLRNRGLRRSGDGGITFRARLARRARATALSAATLATSAALARTPTGAAAAAATAALGILGGARLAHFLEDLADALAFLGIQLDALARLAR